LLVRFDMANIPLLPVTSNQFCTYTYRISMYAVRKLNTIDSMKQRIDMRFDPSLLKRIHQSMSSNSGPATNRTDWIEQACYEKVLREEEVRRARQ
jgi:hypothetical protein